MTDALLPCPFCAKPVEIHSTDNGLTLSGYFFINCCAYMIEDYACTKRSKSAAKNRLVKKWNHRKQPRGKNNG